MTDFTGGRVSPSAPPGTSEDAGESRNPPPAQYGRPASVRGIPLDAQAPRDLIWIRHDFLASDADFGKVVVHGHTPVDGRPEVRPNRINVDTGVYFTGLLTAVRLDGATVRFL